jgi:protein SCO1/2
MKLPVIFFALALLFSWQVFLPEAPHAAPTEEEILRQIGVDEKPGAKVPLNLPFSDSQGRRVTLGKFFNGGPVILTLNYYSCPMLCPLTFRNLVETMNNIQGLSLGKDFRIVTVSIDPDETVERTREKEKETHAMLRGIDNPEQAWPFLFGGQQQIETLARTVGYRFLALGKNNFAHPSVLVILTPDGRVARYLYGIEQEPRDLKLALIEASGGKIGGSTVINRVLLYCFHYDPVGKKYALAAINVMKIVGGTVLLFLALLVFGLWRAEKRRTENTPGDES